MQSKLKISIQSPWFYSLIFLIVFLSTQTYKFGWDDQHLEIPLLKHLINNSLFAGDYYIESLKVNFSTYFYRILSLFITVDQIPNTYFALYLVSRYFLFFFIYKLWSHIAQSSYKGFICVLSFILLFRVEEFVYRTFSHQEFALMFIVAGIYLFFKERFVLASIVFGLATNLHALYSGFPYIYMMIYLLLSIKKISVKTFLKCCGLYLICALPFIIWVVSNRLSPSITSLDPSNSNWLSLFIKACPQNFFFAQAPTIPFKSLISNKQALLELTLPYIFVLALFSLNFFCNPTFRKNKKAIVYCLTGFLFLVVCFLFTYLYPNRFVIDLNLTRHLQFLLFLLIGFTTIHICNVVEKENIFIAYFAIFIFLYLKLKGIVALLAIFILMFFLGSVQAMKEEQRVKKVLLIIINTFLLGLTFYMSYKYLQNVNIHPKMKSLYMITTGSMLFAVLVSLLLKKKTYANFIKNSLIAIPFVIFLIQANLYRVERTKLEKTGEGFWALQRNWEQMQLYVKENTPVDSMLLVPYNMEMGGFRILSERKIIASYRDHGIIGFDYTAALEWEKRINDIEPYKFLTQEPLGDSIKNAVTKYNANYIVMMNYLALADNQVMKRVYSNDYYTLYEVLVN